MKIPRIWVPCQVYSQSITRPLYNAKRVCICTPTPHIFFNILPQKNKKTKLNSPPIFQESEKNNTTKTHKKTKHNTNDKPPKNRICSCWNLSGRSISPECFDLTNPRHPPPSWHIVVVATTAAPSGVAAVCGSWTPSSALRCVALVLGVAGVDERWKWRVGIVGIAN